MNILLNDQATVVTENISLLQLLIAHNLHELRGVAVAVNDKVIQRKNWDIQLLSANDKITVIRATQGG